MYILYEGQEFSEVKAVTSDRVRLFELALEYMKRQQPFSAGEPDRPAIAYGYEYNGEYVAKVGKTVTREEVRA
jgi:hypothetical protein